MPLQDGEERFLFSTKEMPDVGFHVLRFVGTEGLNKLFSFRILLVCDDPSLDLRKLISSQARFSIRRKEGADAVFTGYPASVEQGGNFNGFTYYTVELRPIFWKMTQIFRSAIFLDRNISEVADSLLNSEPFLSIPHEFRLVHGDYPKPEFAMQYEESQYDYLLWRMEEQGAYFYFSNDGDRIIFADGPQSHDAASQTVTYSPTTGLEAPHLDEVVTSFTLAQTPLPSKVVVRSYDWKDPNKPIVGFAMVDETGLGDVYLNDEPVETSEEAGRIARIRAEELKARSRVFTGVGAVPWMRPGMAFTLDRHYNKAFNRSYVITEVTHEGSQESVISMGLGIPLHDAQDHVSYRNTFRCIESDVQYRPPRTASRKRIAGVLHAFVDGDGDCTRPVLDQYGRYKLIFPFDVSGRSGGKATCWIRRAQEQIGKNCGMSFQLLPGTEVLVGFIDGNPDRPVITGALPNGETGALTGSGNANMSGIKTEGGNGLIFNNTDSKQGFSLSNASGNGLTVSSGSLDYGMMKSDTAAEITALMGTSVAGIFKNTLTGYQSLTSVVPFSKKKAFWTTLQTLATASEKIFQSLADTSSGESKEKLSWGADAAKMALLLVNSVKSFIMSYDPGEYPFAMDMSYKKGGATQLIQCDIGVGELIAQCVLMLLGRGSSIFGALRSEEDDSDDGKLAVKFLADRPGSTFDDIKDGGTLREAWEDYKKLYKKGVQRQAIVSNVSDLIPELTAMVTSAVWAGKMAGKKLGGISLSSDQNIRLKSDTFIGGHAQKGILLNTAKTDIGDEWGSPQLVGEKDMQAELGKITTDRLAYLEDMNVNQYDSFIAQNTDLCLQESKKHVAHASDMMYLSAPNVCMMTNTKDVTLPDGAAGAEIALDHNVGVQVVSRTSGGGVLLRSFDQAVASGKFCDVSIRKDAIGFACHDPAGTMECSMNKDLIKVGTSDNKGRLHIGRENAELSDGTASFVMNRGTVTLENATSFTAAGVCIQNSKITGAQSGVLELGGAVRITGCVAGQQLSTVVSELRKANGDLQRQLSAIESEMKKMKKGQ